MNVDFSGIHAPSEAVLSNRRQAVQAPYTRLEGVVERAPRRPPWVARYLFRGRKCLRPQARHQCSAGFHSWPQGDQTAPGRPKRAQKLCRPQVLRRTLAAGFQPIGLNPPQRHHGTSSFQAAASRTRSVLVPQPLGQSALHALSPQQGRGLTTARPR